MIDYLKKYVPALILYGVLSLSSVFSAGSTAYAQSSATDTPPEQKKGWHKQNSSAHGIQKGREGKVLVEIKTNIESEMTFTKWSSENAKSCTDLARHYPAKPEYLSPCDAALAEAELSVQNRRASLFNKVIILGKLERESEAEDVLRTLVTDHPDFAEPHYELARRAYMASEYPSAIIHATEAVNRGLSRPTRAYNIIGMAHEKDYEYPQARTAYETAMAKNPNTVTRLKLERLNRLWPAN